MTLFSDADSPSTLALAVKYLVWNLHEGRNCRLNSGDNPPNVLGNSSDLHRCHISQELILPRDLNSRPLPCQRSTKRSTGLYR
jgi:hypothetical protein